MKNYTSILKSFGALFLSILIFGCNNPSEKQMELEWPKKHWKKISQCMKPFGIKLLMIGK